jgi:hypothetical protein
MSKRMQKMPKQMKGKFKQTEGSTPRGAMPASKKAGKSARDKRLAKVAM